MKTGFALIEVIIAATIASMLSVALFLSWGQVQRVALRADNTMSMFDRMMLVQRQFERDFAGICVPISRPYLKEKEKKESEAPPTPQAVKPGQPGAEMPKQEKPKRVERVFYATSKGSMFESLTCLTNNPLEVYWSDRAGAARPRIARIQYRLEQDPKTEKTPSYTLYRQEAYTLDPDTFAKESEKEVRAYAVINGIKTLKLTYWQEIQSNKDAEQGAKSAAEKLSAPLEKSEAKKETKKITEWNLEKEPAPEGTFIRPIPTMINVELSVWDAQKKQSRTVIFMIPIAVEIENPADKKKENVPVKPPIPTSSPIAQQASVPPAEGFSELQLTLGGNITTNVETDIVITKVDQGKLLKELLKHEKGIGEKKP
jgi:type II secretory pathway component PulJ